MKLTKKSPMIFKIKSVPGSVIICKFKLKGTTHNTKVDINMIIRHNNNDYNRKNIINMASSGIQSVYTSIEDTVHTIELETPEFENRIDSFVMIYVNSIVGADIEDVTVKEYSDYINIKKEIELDTIKTDNIKTDNIILVSTWGIKCGIALYTKELFNEFNRIMPGRFIINPVNNGVLINNITGKLVHIQHEFAIIHGPPSIHGKVIITWHTVLPNMVHTIRKFESSLDVVAHIVTNKNSLENMNTSRDVYHVSLGSTLIPNMSKEDARRILGIDINGINDIPIGFVFGFQSPVKNYDRLVQAAINTNIHIIISGSLHMSGYHSQIKNSRHVTILNRYLTDDEINLYSLASDILLFDYVGQTHYSSSSALHRTIGSGRPVICADTKHFSYINGISKFRDQQELESCIKYALENQEYLGKLSLEFAKRTSRESVVAKHLEIYRKYVDI